MDCSWVNNIGRHRPSQPYEFYQNKKGSFDMERVCLGLGIDENHYFKILEHITLLVSQAGRSKILIRDIRRGLRKTFDPILHGLPLPWVDKCIDQLVSKANTNLASAKRFEHGRVLELRNDIPQNQESRLSKRSNSNTNVEPSSTLPASLRSTQSAAWPPLGYSGPFHSQYDSTQLARRLPSSASYDTEFCRNSNSVVEDPIKPAKVNLKREYEPEDNVIGRSIKRHITSRDPSEQDCHISRLMADRYIPEYEADRLSIQSKFQPNGPSALQKESGARTPVLRAARESASDCRMEQRAPEARVSDLRIDERSSGARYLQERSSHRRSEERVSQVRIPGQRAPIQPVEETALISQVLRGRSQEKQYEKIKVDESASRELRNEKDNLNIQVSENKHGKQNPKQLALKHKPVERQHLEEKGSIIQTSEETALISQALGGRSEEKKSEKITIDKPATKGLRNEKDNFNIQVSENQDGEHAPKQSALKQKSAELQNIEEIGSDVQTSEETGLAGTQNEDPLNDSRHLAESNDEYETPQENISMEPNEQHNTQVEILSVEKFMNGGGLSSHFKRAKRALVTEIAFMARRESSDWVLLGSGNDFMESSGDLDWIFFLSRLKAGLQFSLENDKLFCPWLSYTNGEELVTIFDAFGWKAGIGNMIRRGLCEFRFEVKKQCDINRFIQSSA